MKSWKRGGCIAVEKHTQRAALSRIAQALYPVNGQGETADTSSSLAQARFIARPYDRPERRKQPTYKLARRAANIVCPLFPPGHAKYKFANRVRKALFSASVFKIATSSFFLWILSTLPDFFPEYFFFLGGGFLTLSRAYFSFVCCSAKDKPPVLETSSMWR